MLTPESVLALAPDESSAKAARGLVEPRQWPLLGADDQAVWGECQGSGSKPYQTQVDLAGPAFRCTCPSRKFPCKHGLALLLLRVQQPAAFGPGPAPAWVAEWLAGRAEKAHKQARAAEPPRAADPAAAAKREQERWARIDAGVQDLALFLADRVAQGLGGLRPGALEAWRTMAARLVDAQAPGLGQRLNDAADAVGQREDWPERLLHRLGLLQLACDAVARRETLDPGERADLRALLGWPLDKAEVLAQGEPVTDLWTVLGVATEARDARLLERRVWLQGRATGRRAWLLDHAMAAQGFDQAWLPGVSAELALAFYPSARPLRALCATPPTALAAPAWPATTWAAEWDAVAARIAGQPWTALHPVVLPGATVLHDGTGWQAAGEGRRLPLALADDDAWALLARGGGQPLALAGEWDGRRFAPLTAWSGDQVPLWQRGGLA